MPFVSKAERVAKLTKEALDFIKTMEDKIDAQLLSAELDWEIMEMNYDGAPSVALPIIKIEFKGK